MTNIAYGLSIGTDLDDLERRNYFAFFHRIQVFQADYITVVEAGPIMSVKYCQLQSSTFGENYNVPCSTVSLR